MNTEFKVPERVTVTLEPRDAFRSNSMCLETCNMRTNGWKSNEENSSKLDVMKTSASESSLFSCLDTRGKPQSYSDKVNNIEQDLTRFQNMSQKVYNTSKNQVRITKSNPEKVFAKDSWNKEKQNSNRLTAAEDVLDISAIVKSWNSSETKQTGGLNHLDNLVKLMEQLSQLKFENGKLKKRCEYLESTKQLLQRDSSVKRNKIKDNKAQRKRLGSADDDGGGNCDFFQFSSGHNSLKRSHSTGSVNAPDFIIKIEDTDAYYDKRMKKNSAFKKSSKWTRVKKVLTGQKSEEEINVKSSSNSNQIHNYTKDKRHLLAPTGLRECKSIDSGVISGPDAFVSSLSSKAIYSKQKSQSIEELSKCRKFLDIPFCDSDAFLNEASHVSSNMAPIHKIIDDSVDSQYLDIAVELPRRTSSPSFLSDSSLIANETDVPVSNYVETQVHRTTSSKSDGAEQEFSIGSESRTKYRAAWKRVKDIITHRDSTKRQNKKQQLSSSELKIDNAANGKSDSRMKETSDRRDRRVSIDESEVVSSSLDLTLLVGTVSEDFTKKMAEWETKKQKKFYLQHSDSAGECQTNEDCPEKEVCDFAKDSSSNFSRKLQAWEKLKSQRLPSPRLERKFYSFRRSETKSKKSKEEKDKDRLEKQRDRDYIKVEKQQQKLEKEKSRLNKERLKALEKEAKIEKIKGRLESGTETTAGNPVLKPLSKYKVTSEFAKKLHDWEIIKGLSNESTTALYLEIQKRSMELAQEMYGDASFMSHHRRSTHRRNRHDEISQSEDSLKSPHRPFNDNVCDTVSLASLNDLSKTETAIANEEGLATRSKLTDIEVWQELQKSKKSYLNTLLEVRALCEKRRKMKLYYKRLSQRLKTCENFFTISQDCRAADENILSNLERSDNITVPLEVIVNETLNDFQSENVVEKHAFTLANNIEAHLEKENNLLENVVSKTKFNNLFLDTLRLLTRINKFRIKEIAKYCHQMDSKRRKLLSELSQLWNHAVLVSRQLELQRLREHRRKTLKRSYSCNKCGARTDIISVWEEMVKSDELLRANSFQLSKKTISCMTKYTQSSKPGYDNFSLINKKINILTSTSQDSDLPIKKSEKINFDNFINTHSAYQFLNPEGTGASERLCPRSVISLDLATTQETLFNSKYSLHDLLYTSEGKEINDHQIANVDNINMSVKDGKSGDANVVARPNDENDDSIDNSTDISLRSETDKNCAIKLRKHADCLHFSMLPQRHSDYLDRSIKFDKLLPHYKISEEFLKLQKTALYRNADYRKKLVKQSKVDENTKIKSVSEESLITGSKRVNAGFVKYPYLKSPTLHLARIGLISLPNKEKLKSSSVCIPPNPTCLSIENNSNVSSNDIIYLSNNELFSEKSDKDICQNETQFTRFKNLRHRTSENSESSNYLSDKENNISEISRPNESYENVIATKKPESQSIEDQQEQIANTNTREIRTQVVTFDQETFSDSEIKPKRFPASKTKKLVRPKSIELSETKQPFSPTFKRRLWDKIKLGKKSSYDVPSSPNALEALCQQSITFDLGVSAQLLDDAENKDTSIAIFPPMSPQPSRSKARFLGSAFQQTKKLFKKSKHK